MPDNTKQLERERIIFLQGIKEDDAIKLSKEYPNLVIFSKGDKIDDVWHNGSFNDGYTYYSDNDNYQCDDIMFGANIIKNGIRYSLVKGVHPQRNSININGQNISLYLDKNGFINLVCNTYKIIFDKQTSTYLETTSRYINANSTIGDLPIPKKEYTITWDANGGLIEEFNSSIYEQKVTWDWAEENNYWSLIANSSNGTGKITSSTIPNGDTTYYACWNIGPSGNLESPIPTREFYNFDGWQNYDDNNPISLSSINSNITYVAQWTRNAIGLSISSNKGNYIAYNGSTILTANVTNGNANQTTWNITPNNSYATISSTTGASITLNGNNNELGGITNIKGNVSLDPNNSYSINYGENTNIKINASNGTVKYGSGPSHDVTVTANNTGITSSISITVQGKTGYTEQSPVYSYVWEITNGVNYAGLEYITTDTCKVINNNNTQSDQTITLKCKVTWQNGTEDDLETPITIKAQEIQPVTTYYWYVGYDQDAYEHPESFKANMYTTNTNAVPTQYSKSGDNGLDISGTGTRPNYIIMIIPSTWSVPTIWDSTKQGEIGKTLEKQNVTITGISGVTFNVWSSQGNGISDSQVYIN